MKSATRIILMLILMLPFAGVLSAQATATVESGEDTTTTATETADTTETAATTDTAAADPAATDTDTEPVRQTLYETRNQFTTILRNHPYEVAGVFALDPSLLSNQAYMANYPEIARFLDQHPEVRRNPRFYLAEFAAHDYNYRRNPVEEIMEALSIAAIFALIAFALGWLVRTIIEQKRWNKLSRTQSEVHNKILDRFGSSDELLQYIKTPAGSKFLESAPIPLHTEPPAQNTPVTRVMWSIQIGVIVAAAALGMLLVSFRFEKETAQGLFAMGAIAFCVGGGFIASALVSLYLSRRLGSWPAPGERLDDAGSVR